MLRQRFLGDRRHGFRLEVSHPLLELPTMVFSSMEMLGERAHSPGMCSTVGPTAPGATVTTNW
jgi:hypothetical protein